MKVITYLLCFIAPFVCSAQQSISIQVNDIYMGIDAFGQLGRKDNKHGQYGPTAQLPDNDYLNNLFWEQRWASGFDETGTLHFALDTINYDIDNTKPLSSTTGQPINNAGSIYHRVWTVHRLEIEMHLMDYNDNGQIDNAVPTNILAWPGKGNPHFPDIFGIEANHEELAPFHDRNNNGIYEPLAGEYPLLDESLPLAIPDQMCFSVFNDIIDSTSLGCEIHEITFAFSCDSTQAINQTIFNKRTYTNKSNHTYSNFSYGNSMDSQIGCPEDDFYGTSSELNTIYCYNQDTVDGWPDSSCTVSLLFPTRGSNPGVFALSNLSSDLHCALIVPRNGQGFPSIDYFDAHVRHKLLNGIVCSHSLNADTVMADTVGFSYPDFPSVPNGNSMIALGLQSFDARQISSNTIETFAPGDQVTVYRSLYTNSDWTLNNIEEVDHLQQSIPIIQDFFYNDFTTPCQRSFAPCSEDCVWPGDVNHNGVVLGDDLLALQYCKINNFEGPSRDFRDSYWVGHDADEWDHSIAPLNINGKHADCFGDGTVDDTDIIAYLANYRRLKSGIDEPALLPATLQDDNLEIHIARRIIRENLPSFLRRITSTVDHTFPTNHEYLGFSLSIIIDEEIFDKEEFFALDDLTTNTGLYTTSIISFPDENRKDIVFATNRQGSLPQVNTTEPFGSLMLHEDLRVPDGQDSLYIPFPVFNLKAMTMDGEYVEMGFKTDSIWLIRNSSATQDVSEDIELTISPNPTNSITTFQSTEKINNITLFSINGSIEKYEHVNDYMTQLNVADIPSGMYIAQITCSKGIQRKKLIISR